MIYETLKPGKYDDLECLMTIREMNGKKVETKFAPIRLESLGSSGLRFISRLNIPIVPDTVLSFKLILPHSSIVIDGRLTGQEKAEDGHYLYPVEFLMDHAERSRFRFLAKHILAAKRDEGLQTFAFSAYEASFPEVGEVLDVHT
ncbi:hypothetical protein [Paenibacillus hamazuiensis]|uniref:hypothetical protein n=1 Tax=Paenibacillus hamazuiensis TaxID=2936508 RepID=UPI00200ED36A|nr:hypothetical protein [Paenibacillus hamazuiensis]